MATESLLSTKADREILSVRTVNAPRELVFKVWTDPEHVIKWWGPNGFSNTMQEMEVKPGGMWRFIMHGPDGNDYPNRIVYQEVVKPERLVFKQGEDIDNDPNAFDVTVTFEALGDQTRITMSAVFPTAEQRNKVIKEYGALEANKQTMDKMETYLTELEIAGKEFTVVRELNAPRELVFKLWSEAEHLAKWWGPKGFDIKVAKLEMRPGGIFLFGMTTPDGNDMWGRFIYREVVSPSRLVFINSFSDKDGGVTRNPWNADWPLESLNILTLEEHSGKTTLTLKGYPINASEKECQEFEKGFGDMQQGFKGTFDQLEEYVSEITKQ